MIRTYRRPANSSRAISSRPLTVTSKPCALAAAAASPATISALPVWVPYRMRSGGRGAARSAVAAGGCAARFMARRECNPARKPESHALWSSLKGASSGM
ncbi:Uncharacterised protein [Mycobacteroides abscessus subsp. abscessus]|nr:Uncharacterised protein [Mycobacteroides abscessus subsp. abscessus]